MTQVGEITRVEPVSTERCDRESDRGVHHVTRSRIAAQNSGSASDVVERCDHATRKRSGESRLPVGTAPQDAGGCDSACNKHGRRARVGSGFSLVPLSNVWAHHRTMTNVPPNMQYSPHSPHTDPRRTSTRRQRLVHIALAGLIVAISVRTNAAAPFLIVALFVLVVPFEKLFPRHRGQRVRRQGLGTDLTFALATPLISGVGLVVAAVAGVVSLAWLPGLALRPLVAMLPAPALPILGAVLFDLAGYWVHRFAHEKATLWRFHSVHHTGEQLDWLSGIRVHPLDGFLLGPPVLLLIAAGFPAKITGGIAILQMVVGLFLHANVRWRLRPLHRIVATPDFHHWHHANEPASIHTNYAAFLPVWDQLFGTYRVPKDRQPERYGIDETHPTTFVGLLITPLTSLRIAIRSLRSRCNSDGDDDATRTRRRTGTPDHSE